MKIISAAALFGIVAMSHLSADSLGLSEKPPTGVKEVTAKIKTAKQAYPHSVLAQTQLELWLMQLPLAQLTQLQSSIPSPWSASELSFAAMRVELDDMFTRVIAVHPESIKRVTRQLPQNSAGAQE